MHIKEGDVLIAELDKEKELLRFTFKNRVEEKSKAK
jgi:hypothetical protein